MMSTLTSFGIEGVDAFHLHNLSMRQTEQIRWIIQIYTNMRDKS